MVYAMKSQSVSQDKDDFLTMLIPIFSCKICI